MVVETIFFTRTIFQKIRTSVSSNVNVITYDNRGVDDVFLEKAFENSLTFANALFLASNAMKEGNRFLDVFEDYLSRRIFLFQMASLIKIIFLIKIFLIKIFLEAKRQQQPSTFNERMNFNIKLFI